MFMPRAKHHPNSTSPSGPYTVTSAQRNRLALRNQERSSEKTARPYCELAHAKGILRPRTSSGWLDSRPDSDNLVEPLQKKCMAVAGRSHSKALALHPAPSAHVHEPPCRRTPWEPAVNDIKTLRPLREPDVARPQKGQPHVSSPLPKASRGASRSWYKPTVPCEGS